MGSIRQRPDSFAKSLTFATGLLFGFFISVGLGLNFLACVMFGIVVGIGVLISGSLISYLIMQTLVLAILALLSQALFWAVPNFTIEVDLFWVGYPAIILLTPLLFTFKKIRSATTSFESTKTVQFTATVFFGALVQFLRSRMPSDPLFSLKFMYLGEDNAGVVAVLARSIQSGYGPHASLFGEFMNATYLGAAGTISSFGNQENLSLLSVLTHYNMTLLFMAWIPIASMSALVLSGTRLKTANLVVALSVMSALLGLLLWPSILLGHTSVISAGLVSMNLLAVMLNRDLALKSPILFGLIVTSLAIFAGTTWFPLLPFAAASTLLALASLLHFQYVKGNKKPVLGIASVFLLLVILMLPQLLERVINSNSYLQMAGGTRNPGLILPVIWISLVAFVFWSLLRQFKDEKQSDTLGSKLFIAVLATLTLSNLYLLLTGFLINGGEFGYGATKYFLTSIAFSLPILWMISSNSAKKFGTFSLFGVSILSAVIVFLPDSRMVPATIAAPHLTPFLSPEAAADFKSSNSGVYRALSQATSQEPDHLFCVSDFGFPAPGEEVRMESYMCTRWGQSITGDETGLAWRFVPLNREPVSSLDEINRLFAESDVVVIRLVSGEHSGLSLPKKSETWWGPYVDDSWRIITVDGQ